MVNPIQYLCMKLRVILAMKDNLSISLDILLYAASLQDKTLHNFFFISCNT